MSSKIKSYINFLESNINNRFEGLPEEIFKFTSSITPLINVDLLIIKSNNILLTWRDDEFYGPGWHIPGGIIRFKERFSSRINKVAQSELGLKVEHESKPLFVAELFNESRNIRGHFISLLFKCSPVTHPNINFKFNGKDYINGVWMWHDKIPNNLLSVHSSYLPIIENQLSFNNAI